MRFGLLCADTIRSRFYLDALSVCRFAAKALIETDSTDIARAEQFSRETVRLKPSNNTNSEAELNLLYKSLQTNRFAKIFGDFSRFEIGNLRLNKHLTELEKLFRDCDYVIFSGPPGWIVPKQILDALPPLLHAHCGKLPNFGGSTTFYYHLLENVPVVFSGMILSEKLDGGSVISELMVDNCPAELFDFIYDPMFRSKLMKKMVDDLESGLIRPCLKSGAENAANTLHYFVIHPLLKSLAVARK